MRQREFDVVEALRLYRQGMSDSQIADALSVMPGQIQYWRQRNKLPSLNKGGRPSGTLAHHKGEKERYVRKQELREEDLVDRYCKDCKHFYCNAIMKCCEYILHTGVGRPCPAGAGCTVKEFAGVDKDKRLHGNRPMFRLNPDEAKRLYDEGKTDVDIAKALCCSAAAIRWWRKRNKLSANIFYNIGWDRQRAKELYDRGWNDHRIAEELKVATSCIWKWRTKEGLPRHGK